MLPDPAIDDRSDSTALAVAIGGVMCPVPYLMSGVAIRMAGRPGRTRRATAAYVLSVVTVLAQTALIAWLVVRAVT